MVGEEFCSPPSRIAYERSTFSSPAPRTGSSGWVLLWLQVNSPSPLRVAPAMSTAFITSERSAFGGANSIMIAAALDTVAVAQLVAEAGTTMSGRVRAPSSVVPPRLWLPLESPTVMPFQEL